MKYLSGRIKYTQCHNVCCLLYNLVLVFVIVALSRFFWFLQTRRKIKKERKRKEENVYNYKLVIVGQTSEWAQNGQIDKMLEWSTGIILGQWP